MLHSGELATKPSMTMHMTIHSSCGLVSIREFSRVSPTKMAHLFPRQARLLLRANRCWRNTIFLMLIARSERSGQSKPAVNQKNQPRLQKNNQNDQNVGSRS